MPLGVRLSPHDPRTISADRDLAYCTHYLVARAIAGLDPGTHEPWIRRFLEENGIDNAQLCECAQAVARYMNIGVFEPLYNQPFEALERAGFFKLPEPVQLVFCAKLGQVLLSAFFVSARDVTANPSDPPVDSRVLQKAADDLIAAITQHKKG